MRDKSKIRTELDFLSALERGEVVTQMTLAKRIAVSVGLINALVKRAMHKGYVKVRAAPYKRYAYYLTPRGFSEKSRLVAEYLEISLGFYRQARQEYSDVFSRAQACGMRRVTLFGGGDLAEIALLAAREAEVEVDLIFDPETNKERFHGVSVVRTVEELHSVDGVVITEDRTPQQAFDTAREHFTNAEILVPPLLHVTSLPPDFKPQVIATKRARQ